MMTYKITNGTALLRKHDFLLPVLQKLFVKSILVYIKMIFSLGCNTTPLDEMIRVNKLFTYHGSHLDGI